MLKCLVNTMECLCIHMMSENDIEKAQIKLEGRCDLCMERLPNHLATCIHSPHYTVSDKLKHIAVHIDTVLNELEGKIEDNQEMLEEINQLINKLKSHKGKN